MRILISITNLMVGGAQTFVLRLATGLAKNHRVYVYCYGYPDPPTDTVIDASFPPGIEIIRFAPPPLLTRLAGATDRRLGGAGKGYPTRTLLRKAHFAWVVWSRRIDLVNSHLFHSDAFAASCCPALRVPLVISDHGDYRYVVGRRLASEGAVRENFRAAAGAVYVSDSNLASMQPYLSGFRGILRKIYYGFSTDGLPAAGPGRAALPAIPPGAVVFGMVARGIPEKGWEEAILAFRRAEKASSAPIYLILVGDSEHLQQLKKQYGSATIHFTGYTDQPQQWVNAFDAGLLPTYFPGESLPNTVIEYLAAGKPVIATDIGGIAEMIRVPDTAQTAGHLIPLEGGKASVEALAEALVSYARTPGLLRDHGRLAGLAFRKFDLAVCITNYELLFKEITGDTSR
jgi:glycosyltransferase involved in cell wall biosynthesis